MSYNISAYMIYLALMVFIIFMWEDIFIPMAGFLFFHC